MVLWDIEFLILERYVFIKIFQQSENLYSKLDPSKSELLKLSDCSMVLEEQPEKIIKAVKLFLQGLGFHLNHGRSRSEDPRNRMSLQLTGE